MAQVFLSYAHEDEQPARRLYIDLRRNDVDVWFDKESLLPGQKLGQVIHEAIRESRYFVALLSSNSVTKKGFVQSELKIALDMLGEFPETDIFIIPVRLNNCAPSYEKLRGLHWVDLFPSWEDGVCRIMRSLGVGDGNALVPQIVHDGVQEASKRPGFDHQSVQDQPQDDLAQEQESNEGEEFRPNALFAVQEGFEARKLRGGMPELQLTFWDVQHGLAVWIRTPAGQDIAIDFGVGSYGDSNAQFSPLNYLRSKGITLDAAVVTHPHRDHLDDIANLVQHRGVVLLRPEHLTERDVYGGNRAVDQNVLKEYFDVSSRVPNAVGHWPEAFVADNNGGVDFNFTIPTDTPKTNLNNHSIVTVVSYVGSKILIPGDNEPPSWNELLAEKSFLSATGGTDILVAPHHGRESGFSDALFSHISPRLAIISDGRFYDTSATGRYGKQTSGWKVHSRSGGDVTRKCVTTRSDGVIVVKLGKNQSGTPFIDVRIN